MTSNKRLPLLGGVIFIGLLIGVVSFIFATRSSPQDQELESQAKRHGFDPGKYKELHGILKRGIVGKGYLKEGELEKIKGFLKDKSPQFRQSALTPLSYAAGSKDQAEAIQVCRGMLNDPDGYVVASALYKLYRPGG